MGLELTEDITHFYAKGKMLVDVRKETGTVIVHAGGCGVIPSEAMVRFTIDAKILPELVLEYKRQGQLERMMLGAVSNSVEAYGWVASVNKIYQR